MTDAINHISQVTPFEDSDKATIEVMQKFCGPEYDSRKKLQEGMRVRALEFYNQYIKKLENNNTIGEERRKKELKSLKRFEKMLKGEEPLNDDLADLLWDVDFHISELIPFREDLVKKGRVIKTKEEEWDKLLRFAGYSTDDAIHGRDSDDLGLSMRLFTYALFGDAKAREASYTPEENGGSKESLPSQNN